MINYPLYDAIHEKNRLHKRTTHASTQSSPKAQVYNTIYSLCFIMHGLGVQTAFYELEM